MNDIFQDMVNDIKEFLPDIEDYELFTLKEKRKEVSSNE